MSTNIEEDVMRIKKRLEKMMKSNEIDIQVIDLSFSLLKNIICDLYINFHFH